MELWWLQDNEPTRTPITNAISGQIATVRYKGFLMSSRFISVISSGELGDIRSESLWPSSMGVAEGQQSVTMNSASIGSMLYS